ncbi:MAG: dephospho-CoA kinase [Verrucomicrobiales bacterium]|nr:dephospho-CoA kinase [Verrucomicrobiales bacterium]
MIVIAITGGVACGKSLVAKKLRQGLSLPFFSSDDCVAGLLRREPLQNEILKLLGETGCRSAEVFDKKVIRKHAFENSDFREKLEMLLHPLVLDEAVEFLEEEKDRAKISLVEVPLLYEVEFPLKRNIDLVVAASPLTQLARLTVDRGLDEQLAKQILNAQLLIDEKIRRADVVVWNDGSLESLNSQVTHLADRCSLLFNDR